MVLEEDLAVVLEEVAVQEEDLAVVLVEDTVEVLVEDLAVV